MHRYHADNVGSLLRPAYLHHAREQYALARISASEFKEIEDRAVNEAVALQEDVGLDTVTDGEMRRDLFLSQVAQSTSGFEKLPPRRRNESSGWWSKWREGSGAASRIVPGQRPAAAIAFPIASTVMSAR